MRHSVVAFWVMVAGCTEDVVQSPLFDAQAVDRAGAPLADLALPAAPADLATPGGRDLVLVPDLTPDCVPQNAPGPCGCVGMPCCVNNGGPSFCGGANRSFVDVQCFTTPFVNTPTCLHCGARGEPCCDPDQPISNRTCDPGLHCRPDGRCDDCGALNQPCCSVGVVCDTNLRCWGVDGGLVCAP
jgi:hypothetical protein